MHKSFPQSENRGVDYDGTECYDEAEERETKPPGPNTENGGERL